jgi:hypothetical protein
LTGVIVCPGLLVAFEWIPAIGGGDNQISEDVVDAEAILDLTIVRCSEIVSSP